MILVLPEDFAALHRVLDDYIASTLEHIEDLTTLRPQAYALLTELTEAVTRAADLRDKLTSI